MELRSRTVVDRFKANNPQRYWGLCDSFPPFERQKNQQDPRVTFTNENLKQLSLNGIPIAYHHGQGLIDNKHVGKVTHTFNGPDGGLRNLFYIDTDTLPGTWVKKAIELNQANDVSLAFEHTLQRNGANMMVSQTPTELSIVKKGKQDNTKVLWFCSEDDLDQRFHRRPDIYPEFYQNIVDLDASAGHNYEGQNQPPPNKNVPMTENNSEPTEVAATPALAAAVAPTALAPVDLVNAQPDQLQEVISSLLQKQTEKDQQMEAMRVQMDAFQAQQKDQQNREREETLKEFNHSQQAMMEFVSRNPNSDQARDAIAQFAKDATDNMSNDQLRNTTRAISGIAVNAADLAMEVDKYKEIVEQMKKEQLQETAKKNNQLYQQMVSNPNYPPNRFQNIPSHAPPVAATPTPSIGEKRPLGASPPPVEQSAVAVNAEPAAQRQRTVTSTRPLSFYDMSGNEANRSNVAGILLGKRAPGRYRTHVSWDQVD